MEELKIIHSNKQEDRDFINNDQKKKDSFAEIYNEWNKKTIKDGKKIQVVSEKLIEKYRTQLEEENGYYFSSTLILYTSDDLFEEYKNKLFLVRILDNKIVAIAIGWQLEYLFISHVRSSAPGGCTKVIDKLLNFWWNIQNLEFINNYNIVLEVLIDNISAIKCYEKFGFINSHLKPESKLGEPESKYMVLTKKEYIQKYLLLKSIKELSEDSYNINNIIPSKLDRLLIIKNINRYLIKI
jgi:hypothetical protein